MVSSGLSRVDQDLSLFGESAKNRRTQLEALPVACSPCICLLFDRKRICVSRHDSPMWIDFVCFAAAHIAMMKPPRPENQTN